MKLIFPAPSGSSREGRHSVDQCCGNPATLSPARTVNSAEQCVRTGRQNVDPPYPLLWMLILVFAFLATGTTASAQSSGIVEEPVEQEPLTLTRDTTPDAPGTYKITTTGVAGRVYLMQQSPTPDKADSWTYLDTAKLGSGAALNYWFSPVSGKLRLFYRLRYSQSTGYTADTALDIDGDGLTNDQELAAGGPGTDPFLSDTDYDGMPDKWEVDNGLNPKSAADASGDPDKDTLTSLREYQLGTSPALKDSDGDGFNDDADLNPARFDMPQFTALSSWRKLKLSSSRYVPPSGTTTISGTAAASGYGTSSGSIAKTWTQPTAVFPWTLQSAAASVWNAGIGDTSPRPAIPLADPVTPHDMTRPLFSSYQQYYEGGTAFMSVSGDANSQQSRHVRGYAILVERSIRIQAARAMPRAWSIPYTLHKVSISRSTGDWGTVTNITTGDGGQPLAFTFNKGDTFSNAVTLNVSGLDTPVCDIPGQTKDAQGNWNQNLRPSARSLAWITFEKLPPLALKDDPDQDGLSTDFEKQLGTNPAAADSNSWGYNDGDEVNTPVLPPADGYILCARGVDYGYYKTRGVPDFPSVHYLNVGRSNPYKSVSRQLPLESQTYDLGDPLQTAVDALADFPTDIPSGATIPTVDDSGEGEGDTSPVATMEYQPFTGSATWSTAGAGTGAHGTQKGNIHAVLAQAPAGDRTEMYYILRTILMDADGNTPGTTTLQSQPMEFKAGKRESKTSAKLLAKRTGTERKVQENLGKVRITPSPGMAGGLGDMIPSANPNSSILHFVTPKMTPRDPAIKDAKDDFLALDAVEFTATGISPADFKKHFKWDGGTPGSSDEKVTVKRDGTAPSNPVILKILTKATPNTVHAEVDVWIVWSTCTAQKGTAVFTPLAYVDPTKPSDDSAGALYKVGGKTADLAWAFTFKIDPPAICDPSNPERPELSGNDLKKEDKTKKDDNTPGRKLSLVPGAKKPEPFNLQEDGDTATLKWDVSRQVQIRIKNPDSISKITFEGWLTSLLREGQPTAETTPVLFPKGSAEGNDDMRLDNRFDINDKTVDEDDNPYQANTDLSYGVNHKQGELKSIDVPGFWAAQQWKAYGTHFGMEANFREFARLELWDAIRKDGTFWYRISDYYPWHHYLNVEFNQATDRWEDKGCSSGKEHPHP